MEATAGDISGRWALGGAACAVLLLAVLGLSTVDEIDVQRVRTGGVSGTLTVAGCDPPDRTGRKECRGTFVSDDGAVNLQRAHVRFVSTARTDSTRARVRTDSGKGWDEDRFDTGDTVATWLCGHLCLFVMFLLVAALPVCYLRDRRRA